MQVRISHTKLLTLLSLILCTFTFTLSQDRLYSLYKVPQTNGASCLDGSAPAYYLSEGFEDNKNNYLIYFQGGGFCGASTLSDTLESCYKRSETDLGSSHKLSQSFNASGMGLLSPLQADNPLFFDWTKIVVMYCDGSEYYGHRAQPISYKNKKLYFRGSKNAKQIFNTLSARNDIYNGGKIVIGGGSAGGVAAFEWSNLLLQNTKKAKIYTIPDSGFFITSFASPLYQGRQLLREIAAPLLNLVYNEQENPQPIAKCMKQIGFDIVDCFNAANYAKYLKTPIFLIQSPYDAFALQVIVGLRCQTNKNQPYSLSACNTSQKQAIKTYHEQSMYYIESFIETGRRDIGIWAPACVQHCYAHLQAYNSDRYVVRGKRLIEGIQMFLNTQEGGETAPWLVDDFEWPGNKGCSGL